MFLQINDLQKYLFVDNFVINVNNVCIKEAVINNKKEIFFLGFIKTSYQHRTSILIWQQGDKLFITIKKTSILFL